MYNRKHEKDLEIFVFAVTVVLSRNTKCSRNSCAHTFDTVCVDPRVNIALGKPVLMSSRSSMYGESPDVAVDGNKGNPYLHTEDEYGPWVKIDLLNEVLYSVAFSHEPERPLHMSGS